jgi:dihydrofolate reductase
VRLVTFGGAGSLDNRFARSDGGVDWLRWSDEAAAVGAAYWETIDTVVMGRRTHEAAVTAGTPAYPGVANYVCSRTTPPGDRDGVTWVADGVACVHALKRATGRGICIMGGGVLAATLFDAGLIDEIGLNLHPVLLGEGIATVPSLARQVDLRLVECRAFSNGCVLLRYRVAR